MKIRTRVVWLIVVVLLYSAWAVSPVLAHAELVRSNPASNAVLAEAPKQVEILFSEPLEQELSTIRVYDTEGTAVDAGDASLDSTNPERMTVSLKSLPDGIYTVSWQVLSQIDGHVTAGSFPFAVGDIAPSSLPEQTTSTNLPISALAAKWFLLAAAALLAGQFPSMFFVWVPALEAKDENSGLSDRLYRGWEVLYRLGLAGILLAAVLGILAQAGQASGHLLAAPWAKETIQVLTGTRLGVIWLVRVILALIGFWVVRSRPAVWKDWARFAIGLAMLLTISLTSHAATDLHPLIPVLSDWLHLLGMSLWFGGLAHLITGLAALRKTEAQLRTRITSAMVKRFSLMALPSVGVIGLTGMYSAALRLGTWPALFNSDYGHSLLIKQIFVGILLAIAGINFLIISPGLSRDSERGVPGSPFIQRFGRMVLAEIIAAGLLLASVSVMTYIPPARTPPPKSTFTGAINVDDLKVDLTISPALVGQNTFTVRLTPQKAIQSVKEVAMSFVTVEANIPPSDILLTDQGNGVYSAQGSNIGLPGQWLVEVSVRRPDTFDAAVTFDLNIPKSGSVNDKESATNLLISHILLILIGLLILLNFFMRTGNPDQIASQPDPE